MDSLARRSCLVKKEDEPRASEELVGAYGCPEVERVCEAVGGWIFGEVLWGGGGEGGSMFSGVRVMDGEDEPGRMR